MKKILTSILLFIVIVVAAICLFSNVLLAGILTAAMGAPVEVKKVKVGLDGSGIYGLVIHNPSGFKQKILTSIPEASAEYDISEFLKGKIHLKRLTLNMSEVTVERNAEGKVNLMEIKAMKKAPQKQEPVPTEPQKPSDTGAPKKKAKPLQLQIDEVVLNLDKARFVMGDSVKEFNLGVNEKFHDVTKLTSLIQQLFVFILKKVGLSQLTSHFDSVLGGLDKNVGQKLDGFLQKLNNI